TVTPGALEYIPAIAANLGVPLTEIGVITEQKGIRVLDHGAPITIQGSGFKHF
ncbi:MAG: thiamine-phosphate kinase, partial [Magnetococcales bacterium]|nr:thiamine-phosphate kinase [Magnetococcales bacterium]